MTYLRSGLLVLFLAVSLAAQAQEASIDLPYLDPALAQEAFAAEDAGDYAQSAQAWKRIAEAGKPYPNLFFLTARNSAKTPRRADWNWHPSRMRPTLTSAAPRCTCLPSPSI